MVKIKTPEHNFEAPETNENQNSPEALNSTIDSNKSAENALSQKPIPKASTLEKSHSDLFNQTGAPKKVNGHQSKKEWVSTSGGTFQVDKTAQQEAVGLQEAALVQQEINKETEAAQEKAQEMLADANENSAGIPSAEPEAGEVNKLDTGFAEKEQAAATKIADNERGCAEKLSNVCSTVG